MKINNWDIAEANAKQWNVTIGNHSVTGASEWVRGSPNPFLCKNDIGFKPIKIVLLVKGNGREEILRNKSEILSKFLEPVELELDNFENKFRAVLTKHQTDEKSMKRWHTLTLELSGYEYGPEITESTSGESELIVNNPGNIVTPTRIEITPLISLESISVAGICRSEIGLDLPVTIYNAETGKTVVLDGESGLITQEGELKAADVDMWDVPALMPGINKIITDTSRVDLTIKFYPRYM